MSKESPDELLTTEEAADFLGVDKTTLYAWRKQGKLRAYRVGKRLIRFKRQDIEGLLEVENDGRSDSG